jgi:hypothetical protein
VYATLEKDAMLLVPLSSKVDATLKKECIASRSLPSDEVKGDDALSLGPLCRNVCQSSKWIRDTQGCIASCVPSAMDVTLEKECITAGPLTHLKYALSLPRLRI